MVLPGQSPLFLQICHRNLCPLQAFAKTEAPACLPTPLWSPLPERPLGNLSSYFRSPLQCRFLHGLHDPHQDGVLAESPAPCCRFLSCIHVSLYSFVFQTKWWTVWIPHCTVPVTWHMLRNAVGCQHEWVSYKPHDRWVPSSKEGSEIRDMDLGVISWRKQFTWNWWSGSSRRGKCFFNSTLKGSAKKTADMYYAQSTLHGFPFDAFYLPRRAGGTLISFLFSLCLLASFQLK